jgi:hypothetical protein
MQTLQVYIDGGSGLERVDLFQDESVSITQTIKNVKDIEKVFTPFTRDFSLPASATNNRIFKHYYNYDITNGFDARVRVNARLEINYLPFKEGRLKLNGVDLKNGKPYAYKVSFFGNTIDLKDIIGEDKLTDLTDLDVDLAYDADTIKTQLTTPVGANTEYTIPLLTATQRIYYNSDPEQIYLDSGNLFFSSTTRQGVRFDELKYAVRLDRIIEAIETDYSIEFAPSSFFKNTTYYSDINNLYMWCHRKKGKLKIEGSTENQVLFTNAGSDYSFISQNKFVVDTQLGLTLTFKTTATNSSFTYDVIVKKNGVLSQTANQVAGNQNILIDSFEFEDEFEVFIVSYESNATFSQLQWEFEYFENSGAPQILTDTYNSTNTTFNSEYRFNIKEQIPEMKIIDFLSGLFKMFNLLAYVEDDKIQVLPYNDYYAQLNRDNSNRRTTYDITKYVDPTESQVDVALPFKEIQFLYTDTNTLLAAQHEQELSDTAWGKLDYTDTAELSGGIYSVEVPFSHVKFEPLANEFDSANDLGIQVGYYVDDNEEAYLGAPAVFYIHTPTSTKTISFAKRNGYEELSISGGINCPLNSRDETNSDNIHFRAENSESLTPVQLTETLFKRFYQDYIEEIFSTNRRLTKVTAYLPVSIQVNLNLWDRILIGDREFKINSLTTNLKDGKTELELINL